MRRELAKLSLTGVADNQAPNCFLVLDGVALDDATLGTGRKSRPSVISAARVHCSIRALMPEHGDGPGAAALAKQVRDKLAGLPLLDVFCR